MKTARGNRRPNQCLFCNSIKCYEHIYRNEEPKYNEIACRKHVDDLHDHVDETLGVGNGILRMYSSSTGEQDRRNAEKNEDHFNSELAKMKNEKI